MRLAFWRAGKDKPVVQRAMVRPAPSAARPVAVSESGDLDLQGCVRGGTLGYDQWSQEIQLLLHGTGLIDGLVGDREPFVEGTHERIGVHAVKLDKATHWLAAKEQTGDVLVDPRVYLGIYLARERLEGR